MTQKEKQLLLKDLCARLPYGAKVFVSAKNCHDHVDTLHLGDLDSFIQSKPRDMEWQDIVTNIKPYLRPLSSMTEEEKVEYHKLCDCLDGIYFNTILSIDWLYANHFDCHGLIRHGLGIAVTQENNPYKK